ncbi:hypothetical protein F4806DRAFT_471229 [Annulohypoxylon nitens]|nr:hypothetical protein F4806DRAFT_471229 [Annulohypoxylon nitens]
MSVRSHCYNRASRVSLVHLIRRPKTIISLNQERLFHATLPRQGKMGERTERIDTIQCMRGRILAWLKESKKLYRSILDEAPTFRILQTNPEMPAIRRLKEYNHKIDYFTTGIRLLIHEVIEFKINHIVRKVRPTPKDEIDDLWLQEKIMDRWKIRSYKRQTSHVPYIRNTFTSTQYNFEILNSYKLHRHMALLMEGERLNLETLLHIIASLCNRVSNPLDTSTLNLD